jgi:hypothetical protein
MKTQTIWWIVGGIVVVGGAAAFYYATRKPKTLPAAGDSKALLPATKPASNATDTAPVLPGTRQPATGIEAALSTATARIGSSVDWAASLAEGTPR